MEQVKVDGQPIPGVFKLPGGKLIERQVRQSNIAGVKAEVVNCDLYARLDENGKVIGTFPFPVEKHALTLSRDLKVDGESRDLYLDKVHTSTGTPVFRWATADDLAQLQAERKRVQAEAALRAKAADPLFRDERQASMMADAVVRAAQIQAGAVAKGNTKGGA